MSDCRYSDLLYIKYDKSILIQVIIGLIFVILILTFHFEIYDVKTYTGIYQNDHYFAINLSIYDSDTISSGEFIKINDQKYEYEIIKYEDILYNGINYYQTVNIKVTNDFINNEVATIKIYSDKEKVIQKILKLIT